MLEYVDVSDVNMEEGSLRVDANISIRERGATKLGTKTEVKNMNSFSGVERALDAGVRATGAPSLESRRTCRAADTCSGTRDRGDVRPARSKEGSHDYRYFPEPDLPPLSLATGLDRAHARSISRSFRTHAVSASPHEYKLGPVRHRRAHREPAVADYFEAVARAHGDPKAAANWVMGEVLAALKNAGAISRPLSGAAGRPRRAARLVRRRHGEPQPPRSRSSR